MPLMIRPHTLMVRSPDVQVDDLRRANALDHLAEETRVMGKAEPLGAQATLSAFGVELAEAYRVMVNLEDTDAQTGEPFVFNALIRVPELGEWLRVEQLPTRHGASPLTSHAVILCQKTTPPGDVLRGEG